MCVGAIDQEFKKVDICSFIAKLAQMAEEERVVLRRPDVTFHHIQFSWANDIKQAVQAHFDSV
jgi:hypothetical protein